MKYGFKLALFMILVISPVFYCQQEIADSLTNQLEHSSGEKKVDLLNELSDIYQYINTKIAIQYASKGIELASSINYNKGLASSYGSLGYCYINLDNNKALTYTQKALKLRTELNDESGIATSLNVMGVIYYYKGDYLKSFEYHLRALNKRELLGDENKIATSYNNIALVHIAIENYETALDFLNKSLDIRMKNGNKRGIAILNDNIGNVYCKMGKYEEAFKCFDKSLAINKEIGNKKSEANSCFNIAVVYKNLDDTTKALEYYRLALDIYKQVDEKNGIANVENGIASIYISKEMIKLAIEHANIALLNSQQINALENISLASKILQNSYEKMSDYKNAYKYAMIFQSTTDSLMNSDKLKRLTRIEFDYKIDKIKKEKEAELNTQKAFVMYLTITLVLSIIIVILIIFGYSSKRRLNTKLNGLNAKLLELNSTKDRFFSIIAHDLRGPFNGLLGISEILVSDKENLSKEEIKYYIKMLNSSIRKQYELLNDLLEWSKLQSGSFKLKYEKIKLPNELDEVIKHLELTTSQKNIKLINEIENNIIITADKNMIRLVLRNLISNGIKFTNPKGIIRISAIQKQGMTEVTVSDNGVGIKEEDIIKLFRIDVHHSTPGTADEMGTGLGLILCKEIIEKHSGEIRIESKVNEGSKIIFSIPQN